MCRLLNIAGLIVMLALLAVPLSAQEPEIVYTQDSQSAAFYRQMMSGVEAKLSLFEYRPYRESGKMQQPDARWAELGYVPFVRHWGAQVYPVSVPAANEIDAAATAFSVPGELEPISFCIRTLANEVSGLRLTAGALISLTTDSFIPPDSVEIGIVEYFPVRWGRGSSSREWRWHPSRIWPLAKFPGNRFCEREPVGTLKVPPNTTIRFWIRVHTPTDIAPGEYTGSVLVENWGGTYRQPITFTVLPMALGSEGLPPFGAFIPGPLDRYACADLAAHGITSVARWYDPQQLPLGYEEASLKPDFRLEDLFMRRLAEAGIDGPQIIFAAGAGEAKFDSALAAAAGDTTGARAGDLLYARTVQTINRHAASRGWPAIVWGILDKARDWDGCSAWFSGRARAMGRVMGYRANLVSPLIGERDGEIVSELAELVNVWLVADNVQPDETMRRGAVWGYTALTQRDSAGSARERIGLGPWRARRDGMFVWAYNWSGGGHAWNDFDSQRMDWMLSYRTLDDTFLPTPAWEGVREGIEDRRFIRTLDRLINSSPAGSTAAVEAVRFLQAVRDPGLGIDEIDALAPEGSPPSDDYSIAGRCRRALAGHIIRLAAEGPANFPGR